MTLLLAVTAVMVVRAQPERKMTVDELFQLVESNSKTLQQEKISVEFAKKGIAAARSARLPELTASASVSLNGDVVVMDRDFTDAHGFAAPRWGNSLAVEAQQVVYAGGAINAGIALAQLQHERALVGEQQVRQQQRLMALGQYLELFKLTNREQVVRRHIVLTQHLVDDINAKHQQGMALKNDVTRYELLLETLQLTLRKLQDQCDIMNYQLCNQLGVEGKIVPQLNLNDTIVAPSNDAWMESPSILQARIGEKVAHQELRLAKSELLPKVALVAADNLNGPFTYDLPPVDKNINFWYVGLGVKYSVSSLFKQNKKVQQAQVRTRQAQQVKAVVNEQLDNQWHQAYTVYQQAYVELKTQQKSVELARQNYQVVNDRYLSQLALITDMIDASNTKLDAELGEVDARVGIVFAYFKLKYISGTL
ncbi:TolC family protein [Prevotella sp. E13-17]|uniref:TolC family protein n=1 Tax=Prevotella sp. E13-17 TaxID=2913616 RepID=UPI001EDC5020|nr:TolC family protein [Prevotella sp. E13-17]UKK52182.1 TolC family protein [Prevotella sp. E13-17]